MVTQPTYEVIKREDLTAAFRASLSLALMEVLERINNLIDIFSAVQPSGLWTWDYSSRWGYDVWG